MPVIRGVAFESCRLNSGNSGGLVVSNYSPAVISHEWGWGSRYDSCLNSVRRASVKWTGMVCNGLVIVGNDGCCEFVLLDFI